ncbi:Deoxyribose-phosphate aldolase [Methylobacterium crusticola]|uniref:Deoxyribose-phosphate aldolase n=1 Tax=Methylobacterium crusticola TaxID=1697972 RepID=A0ABQ4QU56_9HYPH|nr:deoxyribose-phosphate aldolase [Methylobacterium crusticola]GJD48867.1 Deoxyribose-phosphate aldolase [Methylobacterium crusticola]
MPASPSPGAEPGPDEARAVAARALPLLDLTDLSDTCSDGAVEALCRRALDPVPVAAVCVWPQFVRQAARTLQGTPVRIATVINFPAGAEDVERAVEDTTEALSDGAHEIDLVLPYRALLRGEPEAARAMVEAVRDGVDRGRLLKLILETGALATPAAIEAASRLGLACGADFLKTSTGKGPVSATPEAAAIMLRAIRDGAGGRVVGLKPSGGLRRVADAAAYLDLADTIMGPGWAAPRTLRLGASGLHGVLAAALTGEPA